MLREHVFFYVSRPDVLANLHFIRCKRIDGSLDRLKHGVVRDVDGESGVCWVGIDVPSEVWVLLYEINNERVGEKCVQEVCWHGRS